MSKILAAALPIAAKMLADRLDVTVKIGGSQAATDGRVVYLPDLPLCSRKAEVLSFGFLVHEVGHIRLTKCNEIPGTYLLKQIWNILEDIRIELGMRQIYPGAKKTLSDMIDHLVADGRLGKAPQSAVPIEVAQAYMILRLRSDVLGQSALDPGATHAEGLLRGLLPGSTCDRLTSTMFEVVNCRSHEDVVALAEKVLAIFQEDSDKETDAGPGPSDEESQSSNEPGNSGDGAASGDKSDGESGDDQSHGNGEPQSGSPDNGENQDPGADPTGSESGESEAAHANAGDAGECQSPMASPSSSTEEETITEEQKQNLQSLLASQTSSCDNDVGKTVADALSAVGTKDDDGSVHTTRMSEAETGAGWVDPADMLENTRAATTALRFRMEQLMETQRRCHRAYANSGRRVVPNRLWRLKAGNLKIFERQFDGIEVDTAVMLLLDRSTSMQPMIGLAAQATLSLMLSLAAVEGVKLAAAAFPSPAGGDGGSHEGGKGVTVLTEFGERPSATAQRYASLGTYGGTPMAEALLWATYKLLAQKADRRILFVATDGLPNVLPSTIKILKMACQCGIEIIGLGIQTEIGHLIQESRRIDAIDQMPKAVFEMLESKLKVQLAA